MTVTVPGDAAESSARREPAGGSGPFLQGEDGRRPPSVVHVLDTDGYGGRESVVERLAAAQRGSGLDVRVLTVVEEGSPRPPLLDALREAEVPVDVLRLAPRAYLEERTRVLDLLREHAPDVMHSHGYRPDVVAGRAAGKAGVARVSTVHGFVGGGWKNRLYERIQKWSLRRYERVVAVSRTVKEELGTAGVPASRVRVVRNAFGGDSEFLARAGARERLGVESDRFLVGWVGRLSHEKGPDVLMDAVCRPGAGDVSVSVIGEGPEAELFRGRGTPAPGARVQWHGQLPRARRLFPAFDVFVLSSRTEGTPMVLLEAMAAGVPVVATRVGGVPDVVSEQEAWLVPPEDPSALWRAISEAREDPEEAARRASAAQERLADEFGIGDWVARYSDVYREAVRERAAGGRP